VVEDLDRSTGAILGALDRLGLAEFTLVLITGDWGPDRPHLKRVDAEGHDLSNLCPDERDDLAERLEDMSTRVARNPRGWRAAPRP
jgi:arylsulfatase A-like enzyme